MKLIQELCSTLPSKQYILTTRVTTSAVIRSMRTLSLQHYLPSYTNFSSLSPQQRCLVGTGEATFLQDLSN